MMREVFFESSAWGEPHPRAKLLHEQADEAGFTPVVGGEPRKEFGWFWRLILGRPIGAPNSNFSGKFLMEVVLSSKYPHVPPHCRFGSIIYSPHVSSEGFLSAPAVEAIARHWVPSRGLQQLPALIWSILTGTVDTDRFMSAEDVYAEWSGHPDECTCETFPLPFSVLVTLPVMEQSAHLNSCAARLREREVVQGRFEEIQMTRRMFCIQMYEQQRLCPAWFAEASVREMPFPVQWLAPQLRDAITLPAGRTRDEALRSLVHVESDSVFSLDLLTPQACVSLLVEAANYESSGLPISRPNSMNNYGLILNDIGMEHTFGNLLSGVLRPLAALLFPQWGGRSLDHHHSFLVDYSADGNKDVNLDMHEDDSEVTFNVNLYDDFEGAGLTFCGLRTEAQHRKLSLQYKHVLGRCVVHAGRHRHGADTITSGRRQNLIVWGRSSLVREGLFELPRVVQGHHGDPDLVCLSRTHDRDYELLPPPLTRA